MSLQRYFSSFRYPRLNQRALLEFSCSSIMQGPLIKLWVPKSAQMALQRQKFPHRPM